MTSRRFGRDIDGPTTRVLHVQDVVLPIKIIYNTSLGGGQCKSTINTDCALRDRPALISLLQEMNIIFLHLYLCSIFVNV